MNGRESLNPFILTVRSFLDQLLRFAVISWNGQAGLRQVCWQLHDLIRKNINSGVLRNRPVYQMHGQET